MFFTTETSLAVIGAGFIYFLFGYLLYDKYVRNYGYCVMMFGQVSLFKPSFKKIATINGFKVFSLLVLSTSFLITGYFGLGVFLQLLSVYFYFKDKIFNLKGNLRTLFIRALKKFY